MDILANLVIHPPMGEFEVYFVMRDLEDLGREKPDLVAWFAFVYVLNEVILPSIRTEWVLRVYDALCTHVDLSTAPPYMGLEPRRLQLFRNRGYLKAHKKRNVGAFTKWAATNLRVIHQEDKLREYTLAWKRIFGISSVYVSGSAFIREFDVLPLLFQVIIFDSLSNANRVTLLKGCNNPNRVVFHALQGASKIWDQTLDVIAPYAPEALRDVLFTKIGPRDIRSILSRVISPPPSLLLFLLYRKKQVHQGTLRICDELLARYPVDVAGLTVGYSPKEIESFRLTRHFWVIQARCFTWCIPQLPKEVTRHILGFLKDERRHHTTKTRAT